MAIKRIYVRRDILTNWSSNNPILHQGEIGYDLTTKDFKWGDGSTAWNSLDYYSANISGSGGSGSVDFIVERTYSQLYSLQQAGTLTPGQHYKITDYRTIYNQPETDIVMSGSIEPLIVMASESGSIDIQAISPSFPEDVIYYDFTDDTCEDTSTPRKGRIIRRTDTKYNIDIDYDWRQIKFRRYNCNHAVWSPGTYNREDIVRIAGTGVYISLINNNTGNPASDTTNWTQILSLSIYTYLGWESSCNGISFDTNDYEDVYTFHDISDPTNSSGRFSGMGIKNFRLSLTRISQAEIDYWGGSLNYQNYANNVFYIDPDGEGETLTNNNTFYIRKNNEEAGQNGSNTVFLYYMYNNSILTNFDNNLITGGGFYNNQFQKFEQNILLNDFADNTGIKFVENKIGQRCFYNNFKTYFQNNVLGQNFQSNTYQTQFTINNVFQNNFQKNHIKVNLINKDDEIENSTHLYASHYCAIKETSDNNLFYEYISSDYQRTIVPIN